ncbi:MAG: hypothetical protein WC608_04210 [Parcubacteria group bacterium]
MKRTRKNLSLLLNQQEAIKFDEKGFKFNLHKEHPKVPLSPNYIDFRDVLRDPAIRLFIAELMLPIIKEIGPDKLVDLPQSISPLITTLSDMTGIGTITIRSEALKGEKKDHGIARAIMGRYEKGQRVLIIDDVVSSRAYTKGKAVAVLKEVGLNVIRVIIVIGDREEGGKEVLAKMGFDLISILRFKKVLRLYLDRKLITQDLYRRSLEFARISKRLALREK